jgi:hypothetical protein
MTNLRLLHRFIEKSMHDPRLSPCHITVYLGIFSQWAANKFPSALAIVKDDIMTISKVTGRNSYYKVIRELHDFGYIEYLPSCGKHEKSLVRLTKFDIIKCVCLIGLKFKLAA